MKIFVSRFSLLVVCCLLLVSAIWANEKPPLAPQDLVDLLQVDLRGGRVVPLDNFDLSKPDAAWRNPYPSSHMELKYEQTYQQFGSYTIVPVPDKRPYRPEILSEHSIKVKRNRTYLGSVLIKTDFDRKSPFEFSFNMRFYDKEGNRMAPRRLYGAPSKTEGPDGWERLEWEINVPDDINIHEARASVFSGWINFKKDPEIRIADFKFVELPQKPLVPLQRGVGVTFPGGPGKLPMRVESVEEQEGHIVVKTAGAEYNFDTKTNTIIAIQRVEFPRELAKWESSLTLEGLRIDKKTDDVCVLSNDQLTIGIQGDSMMAISPQHELRMTLTNLLGGDFNRYARGHLYSTDDFGGITVNPYIPMGTGRFARSELLTTGLDFLRYEEREYDKTGKAAPDWQAQWTTSPGELLCTSVFPPRPYPWEESFKAGWRNIHYPGGMRFSRYGDLPIPFVNTWLLWNFSPLTWGHSYSADHEFYSEKGTQSLIKQVHESGRKVIPYISAYWNPSRDADEFVNAVKKTKDKYNIDGIYSDGLPSSDWLLAYKEMRMLRELFPDGMLIVHDSFRQSGKPISMFMPFMYTYATYMYMAEGIETREGENWQYPRYVTSMFRKTNSLGVTKGDKWMDSEGEVMGERLALVDIVYNGRDNNGRDFPRYYEVLSQLEKLWKEKGDESHFYDRYYLPKAQELTGNRIGRAAMPIIKNEIQNGKMTIMLETLTSEATVYYTTDGSTPDESSIRYDKPFAIDGETKVRAIAIASDLEPSAVMDFTS